MDNKESVLIVQAEDDKWVAVLPSGASVKLQDDAEFLLANGLVGRIARVDHGND